MFEHFKGKYEVELKFRLESLESFRDRLMAMAPEIMLEDNIESDWYFESGQSGLANQEKSLSIREMQPADIKLWIVKGPGPDRCEAVEINNIAIAKNMLATMNYRQSLTVQKVRSIYFLGEYHVTIDQLEGIGEFAEVAVMTDDVGKLDGYRRDLHALANQLGLKEELLETRSYREICMNHSLSDCA
ncbi:class IV adenylate cyclase [Endozoicomonas sp. OPT23]|uniref:class IV adenylate cyclase n=1 Tax=Endozoicomonas sp. OPT23 TaxID=2072845 RepID=UPI00129A5A77|nr:class IV adenylate cyclase [Endozoicomonas sp. OPT23]MRI35193.1 class IV adenylate cyclase [Endozoicomonas sp. OPT23]